MCFASLSILFMSIKLLLLLSIFHSNILWNSRLVHNFSRTLACARTIYLATDEVTNNLNIYCHFCRLYQPLIFSRSVFPVLSICLIKSRKMLFFRFYDWSSCIIIHAFQSFSSLNALIKILLLFVKEVVFVNISYVANDSAAVVKLTDILLPTFFFTIFAIKWHINYISSSLLLKVTNFQKAVWFLWLTLCLH